MTTIRKTNNTNKSRRLELNVSVEVKVPPREAQIECNVWLCNEVVMSFISWQEDKPELLVREDGRIVWRCLVRFVPGRSGMLGILGYVDVDAMTQEVLSTNEQVKQFFALAEKLIENAPSPPPRRPLPPQFRPPPHLKAPMGKRIP